MADIESSAVIQKRETTNQGCATWYVFGVLLTAALVAIANYLFNRYWLGDHETLFSNLTFLGPWLPAPIIAAIVFVRRRDWFNFLAAAGGDIFVFVTVIILLTVPETPFPSSEPLLFHGPYDADWSLDYSLPPEYGTLATFVPRVRTHFGRVEDHLLAMDETRLDTLIGDRLEEAPENGESEPGTDLTQGRVIGQRFVEVIARIPPLRKVVAGLFQQLPLRADAREEHQQLQAKEDLGIDRWSPFAGVEIDPEVAHEGEVEDAIEMPVEMILRDGGFFSDEYGTVGSRGWQGGTGWSA